MKKLLCSAIALALLLTACAQAPRPSPMPSPSEVATTTPSPAPTPSPEPTPYPRILQATWLEVDDSHRFWVEFKETDEPSPITENPVLGGSGRYIGLRVNFCETEVTWPEQSFLEGYDCQPYQLSFSAGDWNFDGYTDLAFTNMAAGFRYHTSAFYFWDPETEQFVRDPYGLGQLNNPWRNPETQTIGSFETAAGGSEWYDFYHFQDGELRPLRKCSYAIDWDGTGLFIATVEDFTDGVGQIVFHAEGSNGSDDLYDEYRRWRDDLSYHG